jgi:Photosystem I psaG / psaK
MLYHLLPCFHSLAVITYTLLTMLDASCTGLTTSDPGGYTAVDVLVGGSQGHVVATGVVLGLRAIGAL